jgi:DNA helicase-2/ATP-dependent DNA helicase PcrA
MPPDAAEELARAGRAYLVAAAGCGKTRAVARAAGVDSEGRQLVLTHTHAGVKALKDRLSQVGADRGRVHVDTIAGFALRYAASFPKTSGLASAEPVTPEEWASVYEAARRIFDCQAGRVVLKESYAGMFVDEYQDCVLSQHDLVMAMAQVLPCRVVLDPLQGIFGFAGELVSCDRDLAPTFERVADLRTPWRWRDTNPDLGDWLVGVRDDLENRRPVDLEGAPVRRGDASHAGRISACLGLAGDGGSVVAIGQWPRDCQSIATRLRGAFTCMEPMECPDLMSWSARLEEASGPARSAVLIDFAAECMTRVGTVLRGTAESFRAGATPPVRGGVETREAVEALIEVARYPTLAPVPGAMSAIDQIPGRVLHRRELWREMARTLRVFGAEQHPTLPGAAWGVRDRGRHAGRPVEHRTVSRTLLVKGLEFDHAIVLNADAHDASNLYVALTRGSSSLTVLSAGDSIRPAIPRRSRSAGKV